MDGWKGLPRKLYSFKRSRPFLHDIVVVVVVAEDFCLPRIYPYSRPVSPLCLCLELCGSLPSSTTRRSAGAEHDRFSMNIKVERAGILKQPGGGWICYSSGTDIATDAPPPLWREYVECCVIISRCSFTLPLPPPPSYGTSSLSFVLVCFA